ncbi:MAG: methyltransferase domain-containing protein [Lachnospiraceae bacterium]|nr:methyltransferase domain-containing protein [Lachnospiraceae bacterium]
MHKSSMARMEWFVNNYFTDKKHVKVLDIGSFAVNGSYRELFDGKNVDYVGLDVVEGPNVDLVADDPYSWEFIEDESFDYIISGQAFEHIEYPWLTMEQIYKKLKMGGIICIIAPNSGNEHKAPLDCYRYFADGFAALAQWAGLKVIDVTVAGIPERNASSDYDDYWNDVCLIAIKSEEEINADEYPRLKYERRYYLGNNKLLEVKFLTAWIRGGSKIHKAIENFINQKKIEEIVIYGYGDVGRLILEELQGISDIKFTVIDKRECSVSEKVRFIKCGEDSLKMQSSFMFITVLDSSRELKLYLDTVYENLPKMYIDEFITANGAG